MWRRGSLGHKRKKGRPSSGPSLLSPQWGEKLPRLHSNEVLARVPLRTAVCGFDVEQQRFIRRCTNHLGELRRIGNGLAIHFQNHITLAETQRLLKKKGTVLVDGRSKSEWDQSHLKGALPLPLGDFDKDYSTYEKKLKKAKIIIAYCHGKGCHLSDSVAQDLVNKGFTNVAVFWGGYPEWSAAHLPLVDKNGKTVGAPAK